MTAVSQRDHGSCSEDLERIRRRIGTLRQVAGIELVEAIDGPERGVRKAFVRTGSGLAFTVLIDRGFDLGAASFHGVNLTWCSPAGGAHPHSYQDADGWLRRFPGGLLVTCGPDNVGPESAGRPFHGRHSQMRARLLTARSHRDGDKHLFELEGEVHHYTVFGAHLVVQRCITASFGKDALHIEDRIENRGAERVPLLWLYHCNFGYPLVDGGAELLVQSRVVPRDETAASGLSTAHQVHGPELDYEEQVFFHEVEANESGQARVMLANEQIPMAVCLEYNKRDLPHLTQWKYLGHGTYLVGLEPATCRVLGFEKENEAGRVIWLEPGEQRPFALTIRCMADEEMIRRMKADKEDVLANEA